jgi:hypothetical protein
MVDLLKIENTKNRLLGFGHLLKIEKCQNIYMIKNSQARQGSHDMYGG